ncbi:MAG TPA: bacteriohopanetetrol glucosamine biosynthesis glycosyltransferase HpnI [Terriglobales bacterium]|nr:bacteriohopanetetrol glucosamine biosynthesis glycosyltransferase HpnI [Terriglobales bacterium]
MLLNAFQVVLAVLTLCGIAFYLLALLALRSTYLFRRGQQPVADSSLAVSILKPLKGADSETYSVLRSHCLQEYRDYQIIFGVNDASDAAIPVVRRLIDEFPGLDIRLVICSEVFGANRKVSNLIHLLREAKYKHILVNDGDIRVPTGYLRAMMSYFTNPVMGMVTCLYRGDPGRSLGSRLEALGISTDFAPGVLVANYLEDGLSFGLGSTLAMSRVALDKIGGFEAVVDYLADDYQLGQRIAAAGFKVELASEVVDTAVPPYSFRQFWEHQLRWARTMRVSRPGGYRGLALSYGLAWAILLALFAPHHWWTWTLFTAALGLRVAVAFYVGRRMLRDLHFARDLWLLPLRDLLALAVWMWSYAGDTVTWRGETFRLELGRMRPVGSKDAAPSDKEFETNNSEVQGR